MEPVPYELIAAAKDLTELYGRISPAGPYRLGLFHDSPGSVRRWPPAIERRAKLLDTLVRGAGCLLANDLAPAAFPVISELWRVVCSLRRDLAANTAEPAYFAYLSRELEQAPRTKATAYRLFGEVLAVYLDLLCDTRPSWVLGLGAAVQALRGRLLVQSGSSSSVDPPAGGGADGADSEPADSSGCG